MSCGSSPAATGTEEGWRIWVIPTGERADGGLRLRGRGSKARGGWSSDEAEGWRWMREEVAPHCGAKAWRWPSLVAAVRRCEARGRPRGATVRG